MNIELKDINTGEVIKKRFDELKMSKSEFGRLIGVPQQHINRVFERDTIETKKLVRICRALDYNFFALFCSFPTQVNAYLAAVTLGNGPTTNQIGESRLIAEMEIAKNTVTQQAGTISLLNDQIKILRDQVDILKGQLQDKERIIEMMQK